MVHDPDNPNGHGPSGPPPETGVQPSASALQAATQLLRRVGTQPDTPPSIAVADARPIPAVPSSGNRLVDAARRLITERALYDEPPRHPNFLREGDPSSWNTRAERNLVRFGAILDALYRGRPNMRRMQLYHAPAYKEIHRLEEKITGILDVLGRDYQERAYCMDRRLMMKQIRRLRWLYRACGRFRPEEVIQRYVAKAKGGKP